MRLGLVAVGARMARRGHRSTGVFLRAVVCIALVQIACLLVVGHHAVADDLVERTSDRDVGQAPSLAGERSYVTASTDETAGGRSIARYVVVTEKGPAPGLGGTTVGGFTGCLVSPALRSVLAREPALATRTCGAGPTRRIATSRLLRHDELVAIVYLRGTLPAGSALAPTSTYVMDRQVVPGLWDARRSDASNDLLLMLVPVAVAGVLSLRTALGALQRRDAPWAQGLATLGADRRGVALFSVALTAPAVLVATALAVVGSLALWHAHVYALVFGDQVTTTGALAARCWWVLPCTWGLVCLASILPAGTRRATRVPSRWALLLVLPVAVAVLAGHLEGIDRTQRLLVLYLVGIALLGGAPAVLRLLAHSIFPALLRRRPGHLLLVPWRGLLGSLGGFSRAATPLLAGSLVLTVGIAGSHLLADTQTAFLRREVAAGPAGAGFRVDLSHRELPPPPPGLIEVRALRITGTADVTPVLVAPCRDLERAVRIDLPCGLPGVRLSYGDFTAPERTVPGRGAAGARVHIDAVARVAPAVPAVLGADVLVFGSRALSQARPAWGPSAEIVETTFVGGSSSAVQRARTEFLQRSPTASLQGPRSELVASAASYATTTRRLRCLAVLLMVVLAAGHLVGSAAQRRSEDELMRHTRSLGAPPAVAGRWRIVRQTTDMGVILWSSAVLVGLFGLAADQLDILQDRASYLWAYLATAAALVLMLAVQLTLGLLTGVRRRGDRSGTA